MQDGIYIQREDFVRSGLSREDLLPDSEASRLPGDALGSFAGAPKFTGFILHYSAKGWQVSPFTACTLPFIHEHAKGRLYAIDRYRVYLIDPPDPETF